MQSERLPGDHHRLLLRAPQIAGSASPGQFIHVWCHSPDEIDRPPTAAILRRPLSISRLQPPDGVEVLLRVRGVGGRILSNVLEGARLDLLGPLGHGFHLSQSLRCAVVVAGGIGIAPVPFLLQRLAALQIRAILLVGAVRDDSLPYPVDRSAGTVATVPYLAALGAEVAFVSEAVDGVLVSDLLTRHLPSLDPDCTEIMAIGPRAMVKHIALTVGGRLLVQVSLEERMACGLGACRSCVVPAAVGTGAPPASVLGRPPAGPPRQSRPPTLDSRLSTLGSFDSSYKTVCRDGPVFYSTEIDWERLDP